MPLMLKRFIVSTIFALSLLMPQPQQCIDSDGKYILIGLGGVSIGALALACKAYYQFFQIADKNKKITELEKKLNAKDGTIDTITKASNINEKKIEVLENEVNSLKESIALAEQSNKFKITNLDSQELLPKDNFQPEGEVFSQVKEKKHLGDPEDFF